MSAVSEVKSAKGEEAEVSDQRSEGSEQAAQDRKSKIENPRFQIALLTGGGDKPYALGMAAALASAGMVVDFIGSADLCAPEVTGNPRINFLNLRGDQRPEASLVARMTRVLRYYAKLISYAASARPKLFHILWQNKFELFDRTLLLLYYRLLGKRLVFTAHNVNARKRDGNDSWLNRLSLRLQYRLLDHIFVHTKDMKTELCAEYRVPTSRVSVIPFGINNTVPNTRLSRGEAKRHFGLDTSDKTMLFFGNIAPYKGLEYLVAAFAEVSKQDPSYRLIIAGRLKGRESYWREIDQMILSNGVGDLVVQRIEYVPDRDTELYFKAADVLMLPYTRIFQSGVLFLAYSFGLPVIASDSGSLKEEVVAGKTGFIHEAKNPAALARAIRSYFGSDLYRDLDRNRELIRDYANERNSWTKVAAIATDVYSRLLTSDLRHGESVLWRI
jgi:D-inositol-3-phosphate glycosyltransferase